MSTYILLTACKHCRLLSLYECAQLFPHQGPRSSNETDGVRKTETCLLMFHFVVSDDWPAGFHRAWHFADANWDNLLYVSLAASAAVADDIRLSRWHAHTSWYSTSSSSCPLVGYIYIKSKGRQEIWTTIWCPGPLNGFLLMLWQERQTFKRSSQCKKEMSSRDKWLVGAVFWLTSSLCGSNIVDSAQFFDGYVLLVLGSFLYFWAQSFETLRLLGFHDIL